MTGLVLARIGLEGSGCSHEGDEGAEGEVGDSQSRRRGHCDCQPAAPRTVAQRPRPLRDVAGQEGEDARREEGRHPSDEGHERDAEPVEGLRDGQAVGIPEEADEVPGDGQPAPGGDRSEGQEQRTGPPRQFCP